MLATSCVAGSGLPEICGLNTWTQRGTKKAESMRSTRKSPVKNGVQRQMVLYENLVQNPFDTVHNIMFSHGSMRDAKYIASTIYEFSEDEWNFLEMAVGEMARLDRLSDILPGFYHMFRHPDGIMYGFGRFCHNYPKELYNSIDGCLPDATLRYRLAMYVSIGGAIFNIFTRHASSSPLARVLCVFLFSRPYREDWLDCPLREIEDEVEFLASLLQKHEKDFDYDVWNRELRETCHPIMGCRLWDLITNCQVLRQMARKRGQDDIVFEEPKLRLSFAGIPLWFADKADVCEAPRNVSPLPATSMALKLNPASNAVVPMYPALDECDLGVVLVPESQTVWDAMIRIYGIPKRDPLYPESATNQILLSPQGTHFAQEMSERYGLIYLGLQSLGQYVEEIGELEQEGSNSDYQFHAFVVDPKGNKRRRRR